MKVSKRSPLTGQTNTLDLDLTEEQFAELQSPNRRLIQDIVPHLTPAEREFLMTGYTAEDWAVMFPPEMEE